MRCFICGKVLEKGVEHVRHCEGSDTFGQPGGFRVYEGECMLVPSDIEYPAMGQDVDIDIDQLRSALELEYGGEG